MTPVVLTVNAGSSSLQLHLVRDCRVLRTEHSEHSPDPAAAERTLSDFLSGADVEVTAFHAGLPAAATYALPAEWRRRWGSIQAEGEAESPA
ncbi:hypothetical protein ACQPZZ_09475 [Microbispora sp. CA-135349]|uniref:hypothetical protein n=1 Tax=Microbispora sp. CA-135349 TaxID=3239953 RepID=UPI003D8FEE13